jgi:L-seryl-tRNA(Ser) seleniumtransferase
MGCILQKIGEESEIVESQQTRLSKQASDLVPIASGAMVKGKIYERLGVRTVINCTSTTTPLGQGVMHPDVIEVMAEAAESPVPILELDRQCCKIIARTCGAESALLTTSAAGGLALAFAGCAMRETELAEFNPFAEPLHRPPKDSHRIRELIQRQLFNPSGVKGIKNEMVVPMGHESIYTITGVYAGLKPVWAGTKEKCTAEQLESKITNSTACIFFSGEMIWFHGVKADCATDILSGVAPVATPEPYELSLEDVIQVAHKHDVPVVMDAAYTIPPVGNLKKWVKMGVDIACYCGGKSICGPSDVGFNLGRESLIKLAACHRFPYHGLGRGMKIDKTQMVALTKALQMYPQLIEDNLDGAKKVAKWLVEVLSKLPHVESVEWKIGKMGTLRYWPIVCLRLDESGLGMKTQQVVNLLYDGDPCIWVVGPESYYCPGGISINCQTLYHGTRKSPGNERIVFKRFKQILTKKRF